MTLDADRMKKLAERVVWGFIGFVLITGIVGAMVRGFYNRPDWSSFSIEAEYVWQHKQTATGTKMFGYLPTVVFFFFPFMVFLPEATGVPLLTAVNIAAAAGSIWIVKRYYPPKVDTYSIGWVVLLVAASFQQIIQSHQLTLIVLFLCVAGIALLGRKRTFLGGVVIGLAGVIKLLPFALGAYMLLRWKWKALLGMVVAVVAFDIIPSVAFYGVDQAIVEHRKWFRRAGWLSNRRQIDDPLYTGPHHHDSNFSYSAVLARWLRGFDGQTEQIVLYGDVPEEKLRDYEENLEPHQWLTQYRFPPRGKVWGRSLVKLDQAPRFRLTSLPADVVWAIWCVTAATGFAVLIWATWKTRRADAVDFAAVTSIWLIAVFFATPMMRHYYLPMAFPALAVICRALVTAWRERQGRFNAGIILAVAAIVSWLVGQFCLSWDTGRWYGLHLAVLAVVISATAWAWRRAVAKSPEVLT